MLKTEEREFGDRGYRVTQLPGVKGRKLLVRLYKVLGPSFAALIDDSQRKTNIQSVTQHSPEDIELSSVSAALSVLAIKLKEEDLEYLCDQMAGCTTIRIEDADKWVPLSKDIQNLIFAGRYVEMFKWLGFALEVYFGGFFEDAGGMAGFLSKLTNQQQGTPSDSRATSTGKSGESSAPNTSTSH